MKEIWKDIEGYEGLYQVSNLGRVKTINYYRKGIEITLKQQMDKYGYMFIVLRLKGYQRKYMIHRLVAKYFIPNTDNLPCVNHKDEDKTNNCVDNLEWCTVKYNTNYGTRTKRAKEKLSKRVEQYTLEGKLIKIWESTQECHRNGYSSSYISRCCNGKFESAYNYKWRYA